MKKITCLIFILMFGVLLGQEDNFKELLEQKFDALVSKTRMAENVNTYHIRRYSSSIKRVTLYDLKGEKELRKKILKAYDEEMERRKMIKEQLQKEYKEEIEKVLLNKEIKQLPDELFETENILKYYLEMSREDRDSFKKMIDMLEKKCEKIKKEETVERYLQKSKSEYLYKDNIISLENSYEEARGLVERLFPETEWYLLDIMSFLMKDIKIFEKTIEIPKKYVSTTSLSPSITFSFVPVNHFPQGVFRVRCTLYIGGEQDICIVISRMSQAVDRKQIANAKKIVNDSEIFMEIQEQLKLIFDEDGVSEVPELILGDCFLHYTTCHERSTLSSRDAADDTYRLYCLVPIEISIKEEAYFFPPRFYAYIDPSTSELLFFAATVEIFAFVNSRSFSFKKLRDKNEELKDDIGPNKNLDRFVKKIIFPGSHRDSSGKRLITVW